MDYPKKQLLKSLIMDCRYFHGEAKNPFEKELSKHRIDKSHLPPPACMVDDYDIPSEEVDELHNASLCFGYESAWVHSCVEHGMEEQHVDSEYIYHLGLDYEKDDGTPLSVKSMFFNRYVHWALGDHVTDEGLESFKDWYRNCYASKPTWRELRRKERVPKLLKQCLYYKGEKKNPWEYCYSPLLRKRKIYWYIERSWINRLVFSYSNATPNKLSALHLVEYFKAQDTPLSLVERIVSYDMLLAKRDKKKYGAIEALQSFENYKDCVPLGDGPEKYFSFFKGEEKNPYGFDKYKDFSGVLWQQESIIYSNLKTNEAFSFGRDFINVTPEDEEMKHYNVDAWMFDKRFPEEQRQSWYFIASNYLCWVPYGGNDLDKMCEQYIGFHYDKEKSYDEQILPIDVPEPILELMENVGFTAGEKWNEEDETLWAMTLDKHNGRLRGMGAPEIYFVRDEMAIYETEFWLNTAKLNRDIEGLKTNLPFEDSIQETIETEIPACIKEIMDDMELNGVERIIYEGKTYWSIGMVDEEGNPMPIGLPMIYEICEEGFARELNSFEASEILRNMD